MRGKIQRDLPVLVLLAPPFKFQYRRWLKWMFSPKFNNNTKSLPK